MENRIIAEISARQIIADLYAQAQKGDLEPNGIVFFQDLRDCLDVLKNGFTPDSKTREMLEQWEYLSEQGRFSKIVALEKGTPITKRIELLCQIEQGMTAIRKIVENPQLNTAATPQQFDSSVPKCFQNNSKAGDLFAMLENTKVIYKGVEQPLLDRKQIPWKPITTVSWAYICTITKAQIGGTYKQWGEIIRKKNLQQVFQKSGKILFKKEIDAILKGLGYQII